MKKSNVINNDIIEVITKKEKLKGTLIKENKRVIILKLDNGYNIGIKKENIKKINLIKKYKEKKQKTKEIKQKDLPVISILHTGGTIASKVDYKTGAVIAQFSPEEIVSSIQELREIVNIKSQLISNLQSESMRFGHYNLIAKSIQKELKNKIKGIIITHGTDTMHFTAAALSFILENINIPIILVGSQRSSDRGSSDSTMNLICAAKFIANTEFKGIAICMHKDMNDEYCIIIPGTKARKMHTSRRDAFQTINCQPIAEVSYLTDKINFIHKNISEPSGKFNLKLIKENIKIGILRSHTNMFPENFSHFKNYKGLILEGTGLGHFPTNSFDKISKVNEKNKKEIGRLAKKMPLVLTSQCIFGGVNMNIYSPQRELLDLGVIPGKDMTTETAFIKLAWLLSNYKKNEIKELMLKNLRGEINERLLK